MAREISCTKMKTKRPLQLTVGKSLLQLMPPAAIVLTIQVSKLDLGYLFQFLDGDGANHVLTFEARNSFHFNQLFRRESRTLRNEPAFPDPLLAPTALPFG